MKLVDANVVLRHLLDDHPKLSPKAQELLDANEVYLRCEVLCEVVYVLEKLYAVPRTRIQAELTDFIGAGSVRTENADLMCRALALFQEESFDIVDAILCAHVEMRSDEVLTFDAKITRWIARLHKQNN